MGRKNIMFGKNTNILYKLFSIVKSLNKTTKKQQCQNCSASNSQLQRQTIKQQAMMKTDQEK